MNQADEPPIVFKCRVGIAHAPVCVVCSTYSVGIFLTEDNHQRYFCTTDCFDNHRVRESTNTSTSPGEKSEQSSVEFMSEITCSECRQLGDGFIIRKLYHKPKFHHLCSSTCAVKFISWDASLDHQCNKTEGHMYELESTTVHSSTSSVSMQTMVNNGVVKLPLKIRMKKKWYT
jgi:hypothetical protein